MTSARSSAPPVMASNGGRVEVTPTVVPDSPLAPPLLAACLALTMSTGAALGILVVTLARHGWL